jgi:hypothetical protein
MREQREERREENKKEKREGKEGQRGNRLERKKLTDVHEVKEKLLYIIAMYENSDPLDLIQVTRAMVTDTHKHTQKCMFTI